MVNYLKPDDYSTNCPKLFFVKIHPSEIQERMEIQWIRQFNSIKLPCNMCNSICHDISLFCTSSEQNIFSSSSCGLMILLLFGVCITIPSSYLDVRRLATIVYSSSQTNVTNNIYYSLQRYNYH